MLHEMAKRHNIKAARLLLQQRPLRQHNPQILRRRKRHRCGGPVPFRGFFPGWAQLNNLALDAGTTGWWSWVVLQAHSRNNGGTVTLRSADLFDTPVIDFNNFDTNITANGADQKDLQAFYEGVQFAREANKNLAKSDDIFTETFPGPNIQSEQDVKEFIEHEAFSHHASCINPIGADDDKMAVLDGKFNVKATKGLRVVDAGSWPKVPGFFPALPTYILSEKAADLVIADAKKDRC